MPPLISSEALAVLTLEEELLRARKLEATGKERLEAQEKRVAGLKAKNMDNPPSERLLGLMRETHRLQVSHVTLLEAEIRELVGETES